MVRTFPRGNGRRICAVALAFALALAFVQPSHAEIEPKYYRAWQAKATEVLAIRIEAVRPVVTSAPDRSGQGVMITTRVDAEATVEKVERSASGLKSGDTIRIRYVSTRAEPPIPGPRPIPVLKRGETYPAFLLGVSKGIYAPAAKGASFEPLIELK